MYFEASNRFDYGEDAASVSDWKSLLPSGGHTIHLGKDRSEIYTVSLFHQLRCLDIIGDALVAFQHNNRTISPDSLTTHCMDYIRQMAMCRADTRIESARSPIGPRITVWDVRHTTCRNWENVYSAAEQNYRMYSAGDSS